MANRHMKRCSIYVIRKCKEKKPDATTYSLAWPQSRTLTIPNAGEDGEQQELPFTDDGNEK